MGAGKLPRGLYLRGETLWIRFSYRGVKCYESTRIINPTKAQIKYTANRLAEIQRKIYENIFSYAEYFPDSKKTLIFGNTPKSPTVGYYLDKFYENARKRGLAKSTLLPHQSKINSFKHWKTLPVKQLTTSHIQTYISTNSHLTTATLRGRFSVLSLALDEAVLDGIIVQNPARVVSLGNYLRKADKVDRNLINEDVKPFSKQEQEAILNSASTNMKYYNLISFLFETGVRSSEACGLLWSDITKSTIHIRGARVLGEDKKTKTASGARRIPISDACRLALENQVMISGSLPDKYVFINRDKRPIIFATFRESFWKNCLKRANVEYRYPYQTRHTFASRLISQGINLWKLTKLMGHTSPKMLYEHYGYYIEEYEITHGKNEDEDSFL
jgi:integrase